MKQIVLTEIQYDRIKSSIRALESTIERQKSVIKELAREIDHWMEQGIPIAVETHEALESARKMEEGNE